MFGSLLSAALKVVTLPVDVVEIAADAVIGGDGDRSELKEAIPTPLPSDLRNRIADALKDIDE